MSADREIILAMKTWCMENAARSPVLMDARQWIDAACKLDDHMAEHPDAGKRIRQLENQLATMRKKRRPHPGVA